MRASLAPYQTGAARVTSGLLGAVFLASALLAGELARDEMALRGVICGVTHPAAHCAWCYAVAGFAAAAIAAFALALQPPNGFGRLGLLQIKAARRPR